jgi:hypothetical protein
MKENTDLQQQIDKLRLENQIMKMIATPSGFFKYYFEKLKDDNFKTDIACFNYVNELYFEFFGVYKYTDYNSFRKLKNKTFKK